MLKCEYIKYEYVDCRLYTGEICDLIQFVSVMWCYKHRIKASNIFGCQNTKLAP